MVGKMSDDAFIQKLKENDAHKGMILRTPPPTASNITMDEMLSRQQGTVPHHDIPKIYLALIDDSPYQPRMQYDPMEIDNLAHSMAAAGQEDPITIREKTDGRYELIGGHRRVRAARSLGWAEIAANIVDRSDRDAELATMVSNEARVDLSDYERGKLYQKSISSGFAATQTEIAHLFGTTQASVSRRMGMLKLPANYIAMLDERPSIFGADCAKAIIKLIDEYPDEQALIEAGVIRIKEESANEKSVTQWVQQAVKAKLKKDAPPSEPHSVVADESGREMFTAKFDGDDIHIKVKMDGISEAELKACVLGALRQLAGKIIE